MNNNKIKRASQLSPRYNSLSLRKNFLWTLTGNIVYAGSQWGIIVVLTKLTSPEMVGRFVLGLTVTAPIFMLSWLQLRGMQATDTKQEYSFGQYLGLRLVTTFLALLIIAGVVLVSNYPLDTATVIVAVGFSKAFESISDVYYGLMQYHERMDRIALSRIIKGPLSLVALGAIVYLTGEAFWGAVALTVAWCLLLLFYDLPNSAITLTTIGGEKSTRELMRPEFNFRRLSELAWLALPLGVGSALLSLQSSIPRFFIESYWGGRQLGIFGALVYIIIAGNTVVAAIGQSAIPRLAKYYYNNEIKHFKYLLLRMLGIGIILAFGGALISIFFGHSLLTILYRSEYAEHNKIFCWVMVAGGLSYIASFLNNGITATRNFKVYVPLFLIVNVTTLVTSMWLIPDFGLIGAAFSLAIGHLTQIVASGFILHSQFKSIH